MSMRVRYSVLSRKLGPGCPKRNHERLAVLGLGYCRLRQRLACLSKLGHVVIGVDRDRQKVESVQQGRAPFL